MIKETTIALIIIILAIATISLIVTENNEKITTSISNENMEKIASESLDNLINNPGFPINWHKLDKPYNITPGLAITNEYNETIPNSISYNKFIKLGEFYQNLIDNKLFNNQYKSSLTLKSTISSVTIGDSENSENIYTIERKVICDYFSNYVICEFNKNTKCNHNHNEEYSCNYFKIYKSWLDENDYYLLVDDYKNLEYTIDNTENMNNDYKKLTSNKIYLNDLIENDGIYFIHFKNKNVKAAIIKIPKEFNKNFLKYELFQKNECKLILKLYN